MPRPYNIAQKGDVPNFETLLLRGENMRVCKDSLFPRDEVSGSIDAREIGVVLLVNGVIGDPQPHRSKKHRCRPPKSRSDSEVAGNLLLNQSSIGPERHPIRSPGLIFAAPSYISKRWKQWVV